MFVKVQLSVVTALISTTRSFAGENVRDKWLLTIMVVIKNDKMS
jgi:hypothetical protein